MTFIANGTNLLPFIAVGGLSYSFSDIDDPDAGRDMSGDMDRGKVAEKEQWTIKCRPLTSVEASMVLQIMRNEFVTVRFLSPCFGYVRECRMYCGDRKATHMFTTPQGVDLWEGLSFSLVEK